MTILDSSQRLAGKAFQMRPMRKPQSREPVRFDARVSGTRDAGVIRSRQAAGPAVFAGGFGAHGQTRGRHYTAPEPVGGPWKRCFDFAVALSAIVIMAPLIVAVALLILATMGRPIVFVQERMGFGGKPFRCVKFRTMVPDAQERLAHYLACNAEAARLWRDTQKLKHDPRITWVGHVLRKSSLDELPQLFNILRGDMSCVRTPGPCLRTAALWPPCQGLCKGQTGAHWFLAGQRAQQHHLRPPRELRQVLCQALVRGSRSLDHDAHDPGGAPL